MLAVGPADAVRKPLGERRRDVIMALLAERGAVRVSELTARLGVSDMTVRRDLDALAATGRLRKVHGGATLPASSTATVGEPGFAVKVSEQEAEKRAIAAHAASLVRSGTAIGLTAGTTTWQLAAAIEARDDLDDLTVITNSIRIYEVLGADVRHNRTVALTGGTRTPSDALVGPVANLWLEHVHLDQLFLGVHGMAAHTGLTTPNLLEAETDRRFVDAARKVVVVADHTKWGTVGVATIAPLSAVDVLVTDDRLDAEAVATLRQSIDDVHTVAVATEP